MLSGASPIFLMRIVAHITVWAVNCSVVTDKKASFYLSQGHRVRHFDKKAFTHFALLHIDVSPHSTIYLLSKSRGSILWIHKKLLGLCWGRRCSEFQYIVSKLCNFWQSRRAGRVDFVKESRIRFKNKSWCQRWNTSAQFILNINKKMQNIFTFFFFKLLHRNVHSGSKEQNTV